MQTPAIAFPAAIPPIIAAFAILPGWLLPAVCSFLILGHMQVALHTRAIGLDLRWHTVLLNMLLAGFLYVFGPHAYLDYAARSRVSAGIVQARGAQESVERDFARDPASKSLGKGWVASAPAEGLQSVAIDGATGVVTLRFSEAEGGTIVRLAPALVKGKPADWRCSGNPSLYLPASCREPK